MITIYEANEKIVNELKKRVIFQKYWSDDISHIFHKFDKLEKVNAFPLSYFQKTIIIEMDVFADNNHLKNTRAKLIIKFTSSSSVDINLENIFGDNDNNREAIYIFFIVQVIENIENRIVVEYEESLWGDWVWIKGIPDYVKHLV